MSRASTSGVRRAKAFLVPSGLINVLANILLSPICCRSIPDQSVDFDTVNVILLLERVPDLSLVRLGVADEDKGVVLFNLLHRTLGVQWVNENLVLVDALLGSDTLAWVLWCARELEGLWAVEGCRQSYFADLVRVDL